MVDHRTAAGLGKAIAEAVIAHGDEVVATSRSTGPLADLGAAQVLPMDVTDPGQVRAGVAAAIATGGIVVLALTLTPTPSGTSGNPLSCNVVA
ncbi:hypothetical protein WEH80_05450 [Actinomycetes bacterium KLBMP 9759]